MREAFIDKSFHAKSLAMIVQANEIIADHAAQGFLLTLRQLYYQFVSRGLIANKQSEYKRLGSLINDARLAGLIDWDAIEDRTRYLRAIPHWRNPRAFMQSVTPQYAENLWAEQEVYCEVWIEKDALVGVIEGVCDEFRAPYFACRGYNSQTEQYIAGKRLARFVDAGKSIVIFHLGDHDPSGIDMSTDNQSRLEMFSGGSIDFRRLALNMDQVEQYEPPPNPAKDTDSRFNNYYAEYGNDCWELDALSPTVIAAIVRKAIVSVIDENEFERSKKAERDNQVLLEKAAREWLRVSRYVARMR